MMRMTVGELLTRSTIWISISSYVVGTILLAAHTHRRNFDKLARLSWTVGCLALAAHFIAAFHYYHHWSQLSALHETARQTREVFGINWGGGLVINYLLLLLWIIDVSLWWLRSLDSYSRRPLAWLLSWHGFLIFIIFNATVVFKQGLQRWVGLVVCLILCLAWYSIIKRRKLNTI